MSSVQTCPFIDWKGMIHFLKGVQNQNDDAVILIDGPEGSGKSTLAFFLCAAMEDFKWNPEDRVIIDYEDWLEYYEAGIRGCTYLLDEGGDLAFSRDAMSGQNKHVVRILQMARILNNVVVICCPNKDWLDKYLREHRALIYIKVHKEWYGGGVLRGRATVHWKYSKFNPKVSGGINANWRPVFDVKFKPVPKTNKRWVAYEQLKVSKINSRAYDLLQKASR